MVKGWMEVAWGVVNLEVVVIVGFISILAVQYLIYSRIEEFIMKIEDIQIGMPQMEMSEEAMLAQVEAAKRQQLFEFLGSIANVKRDEGGKFA